MAEVIRVLIVTDGSGGFHPDRYNPWDLGEFVRVLQQTQWHGFTIQITKAHRGDLTLAQAAADLVNFDFSTHDLSQYDEILLFAKLRDNERMWANGGLNGRSSNATDAEVAAIARFMDAGGGVFATGDHEDLGAGLCKRLPRIRNMRRWHWDTPGPNGEPVAPRGTLGVQAQGMNHTDAELVDRHDTLVVNPSAGPPGLPVYWSFEHDNVAQEILPRMFEIRKFVYVTQSWPHPLLCSPEGIVRYLPDHSSEGQCDVPANLTRRVQADNYDEEEYPTLPDGTRQSPVLVADARVIGGYATNGLYPPANPRTFGVIGAYDGHRVERDGRKLGRVVVDSSYHHFVNGNLIGNNVAGTVGQRGFRAPLEPGQADHYRMIKHYYRNIIYWLIPAHRIKPILYYPLTQLITRGALYELSPVTHVRELSTIQLHQLFVLGQLADAYFRNAHGACWKQQFFYENLYEIDPLRRFWERIETYIDPWVQPAKPREPDLTGLHPRMLTDALLGSVVLAVLQANAEIGVDIGQPLDDEMTQRSFTAFERLVGPALLHGVQLLGRHLDAQSRQLQELSRLFMSVAETRQAT